MSKLNVAMVCNSYRYDVCHESIDDLPVGWPCDCLIDVLTVFPITIGKGERALRMQYRVDLVPVHRNELIVGGVLHFLQTDELIASKQKMVKT